MSDLPSVGVCCPKEMIIEDCIALAEELQADSLFFRLSDTTTMADLSSSSSLDCRGGSVGLATSSNTTSLPLLPPQQRWGTLTDGSGSAAAGWVRKSVGVMDASLRWDTARDRATIKHLLGMAEYLSLKAVVLPPPTSSSTSSPPSSSSTLPTSTSSYQLAALDIASLLVEFSGDDGGGGGGGGGSDIDSGSGGTSPTTYPWRASLQALLLEEQRQRDGDEDGNRGEWGGGCALSSTHLWLPCTPTSSSSHFEIMACVRGLLGQDPSSLPSRGGTSSHHPPPSSWSTWEGVRRNWHLHAALHPILDLRGGYHHHSHHFHSTSSSSSSSLGVWAGESVQAVLLPLPTHDQQQQELDDSSDLDTDTTAAANYQKRSKSPPSSSFWKSNVCDEHLWRLLTDINVPLVTIDVSSAFIDSVSIRASLNKCGEGFQHALGRMDYIASINHNHTSSLPSSSPSSPPPPTPPHLLSAPYWRVRRALRQYEGRLQEPLQPLADHLLNRTYGVFEGDDTKYLAYENAVYRYLRSSIHNTPTQYQSSKNPSSPISQSSSPPSRSNANNNNNSILHIVVLGAGRGPLVSCVLRAYKRATEQHNSHSPSSRPQQQQPPLPSLLVSAVEKNPYAFRILKCRGVSDLEWRGAVAIGGVVDIQLALGDGRGGEVGHGGDGDESHSQQPVLSFKEIWSVSGQCTATTTTTSSTSTSTTTLTAPVDVVVSELLGSFGDNELSPECIEGFMGVIPWRGDCGDEGVTNADSTSTSNSNHHHHHHHQGQTRPVCIPARYQSVIEPITSYSVVELLRGLVGRGGGVPTGIPRHQRTDCLTHTTTTYDVDHDVRPTGAARALHVPYVVLPSSFVALAPSGPQPVFAFTHNANTTPPTSTFSTTPTLTPTTSSLPPSSIAIPTRMHSHRQFTVGGLGGSSAPLHGLLGYFECALWNEDIDYLDLMKERGIVVAGNEGDGGNKPATSWGVVGGGCAKDDADMAAATMSNASSIHTKSIISTNNNNGDQQHPSSLPAPFDLSTVPSTHTPDMSSWFPIYFPLVWSGSGSSKRGDRKGTPSSSTPTTSSPSSSSMVQDGDVIVLDMWRCSCPCSRGAPPSPHTTPSSPSSRGGGGGGCVWYEWRAGIKRSSSDDGVVWSMLMNVDGVGSVIGL